ncbi:CARDB domain-containing protein [Pyrococcus abyssi]|uniref:CARDB domain-containing protein n=1 Tax=Pyrococcus abyssi (strain GE5 / Orsay) TaxID=272844 RepID=G8ZH25_PYRAB|nr:CARDB domain-containing protein [Pyrococcus abyssi]CCE70220.1 TPA: hypothetical protein PAB0553 [Pyrococcus abyssi GE5]
MKRIALILLILMLEPLVLAQPILVVNVTPEEVGGFPGDTLTVNVTVKNVGNETAENVSIYAMDSIPGVLFTQGFVSSLTPNSSYTFPMKIYLIKPEAGLYDVTIVSRVGNQVSECTLKLKVRSVVNFTLSIEGEERYLYGTNVTFTLGVDSQSNLLLYGDVKVIVFGENGKIIYTRTFKPMISSWGNWEKELNIGKLPVGNYTVKLLADFYGRKKTGTYNFSVYRRPLTFTAYFNSGKIIAEVREKGKPVKGVKVWINDREYLTDEDGRVEVEVTDPGVYIVRANLDGIIKEQIVNVERPIIVTSQVNGTLIVRVLDSKGSPIKGIPVVFKIGGEEKYEITNKLGIAEFNVSDIWGPGEVEIRSDKYLPASKKISIKKFERKQITTTPSSPTPSKTKPRITETNVTENLTASIPQEVTTTPITPGKKVDLPLIVLIVAFAVTLASSSYLAFLRPIVIEDSVDRYYFVRVKAPRLRGLKNFRFEKQASVKSAWASKGKVKIEGSKVVWEIQELEPEEEATLQLILS